MNHFFKNMINKNTYDKQKYLNGINYNFTQETKR